MTTETATVEAPGASAKTATVEAPEASAKTETVETPGASAKTATVEAIPHITFGFWDGHYLYPTTNDDGEEPDVDSDDEDVLWSDEGVYVGTAYILQYVRTRSH